MAGRQEEVIMSILQFPEWLLDTDVILLIKLFLCGFILVFLAVIVVKNHNKPDLWR